MQATTVEPNETPLPRAVRERALRAQQLLDESKNPHRDPPENPESQTTPETQTTEPPADPRENDPAYWKQRFNVVSGILKREREERKDEAARLNQEISTLSQQVAKLEVAKPVASDVDLSAFFTSEQIEKLGEDQCKAMVRTALGVTRNELQSHIEAAVKPLQEEAKRTQEQSIAQRRAEFEDRLAEVVPTYQQIDTDPRWHEWLSIVDPATGLVRQDLLNRHVSRFDAPRVAGMFSAFLKDSGAAPVSSPPVAPAASVAPANDAPFVSHAKGYPSKDEIRDYYKRSALGKVREAEVKEFEARLQLRAAAA